MRKQRSSSPASQPTSTPRPNTAASTADFGDANAATTPSPVWLNKNPSCASIAVRNTSSCLTSAVRIAAASDSHRRVEPSISVNRNVTTPDGAAAADTLSAAKNGTYTHWSPRLGTALGRTACSLCITTMIRITRAPRTSGGGRPPRTLPTRNGIGEAHDHSTLHPRSGPSQLRTTAQAGPQRWGPVRVGVRAVTTVDCQA